jgi:Tfp pilus assembly protein PilE
MNYRYNILGALTHKKQGFTFVEVIVTAVIVIALGAIAVPLYRQYIEKAQKAAAMAVMEQIPVLVETYRADNGMMCPTIHCTVDGTYTYILETA